MARLPSYNKRNFSPLSQILAYDPSGQVTSLIPGQSLLDYIGLPEFNEALINRVQWFSTNDVAKIEDLPLGRIIYTGGNTTIADGGGGHYVVVETGGSVVLDNGFELLLLPLGDLTGSDATNADVTTSTGSQTVAGALDDRVVTVADLAALKALVTTDLPDGAGARITSTGRAGGFSWDGSDLSTEVSADTEQGIYVAPIGGDGATGAWVRDYDKGNFRAEWFGVNAANDGVDELGNWQAAIDYAAQAFDGAQGSYVRCKAGVTLISDVLNLPNRVAISGPNGRGLVFRPHPTFTANQMFFAANGTSSMFGSRIENCYLDARGFNMTQIILSYAWQETCGLKKVVMQFDGTTRYGLFYQFGYGGAAYFPIIDCECFSESTFSGAAAVRVDDISLVGGFALGIDGFTVAGSTTNPIAAAVIMDNDSLYAKALHIEYCGSGVIMNGAGSASIDTMTGSANQVVDMVTVGSGFTGKVSLRNIIPNGASGATFKNNVTGESIAASEGMLASYDYQVAGFSAILSVDQLNQTGNGTEATVIFDTEIFDRLSEYNNATGIFTAKRAGKYLFTASLKINPTLSVSTCVIRLTTSNRVYTLFRGDTDSLRDASSTITFNGSFIADMDISDQARVTCVITGLAGDTIDFLASESYFQGHWLTR